jgi:hypothetical protein
MNLAQANGAVLSDDGHRIVLTIYRGTRRTAVELPPLRAVALAQELLQAALPKLPGA